MTNSEAGRKAFEEWAQKERGYTDADLDRYTSNLEIGETIYADRSANELWDGCTLEQCWKEAISTIVNKLKEK